MINTAESMQGKMVSDEIKSMTERIAKHLSNVTFDKCRINRLILHFKVDKDQKVWFLWSSSLRIENDKELQPP